MCFGGIVYYEKPWSIIHNSTLKPFITSDNPVCSMEYHSDNSPNAVDTNIYVPLTPELSIFIHATIPSFVGSIVEEISATDQGVEKLNSTIVKFADNLVISNIEADWIRNMVEAFKDHEEHHSEHVIEQGADEVGVYNLMQKRFGV